MRGRVNETAYREYISQSDLDIVSTAQRRNRHGDNGRPRRQLRGRAGVRPYPTSGASDDYAFSRSFADNTKTTICGFTIECGHSFQPTWSEAEEVIREVSAGLIAFCIAAAQHSTRTPSSWLEPVLHTVMS